MRLAFDRRVSGAALGHQGCAALAAARRQGRFAPVSLPAYGAARASVTTATSSSRTRNMGRGRMTPTARCLARPADHDPGSRSHRLSAPRRAGQRRARCGRLPPPMCWWKSCRMQAHSRFSIADRCLRSKQMWCAWRLLARSADRELSDRCRHERTTHRTMRSVTLRRGEAIRIGAISGGACAYLAIEGGFALSRARQRFDRYSKPYRWDRRAEPWPKATCCLCAARMRARRADPRPLALSDAGARPHRTGPATGFFSEPSSRHSSKAPMPSAPIPTAWECVLPAGRSGTAAASTSLGWIAPGSIQIPGDGQPIVLLADRQTTGGYPKIATVISADMPALGAAESGCLDRI